MDVNSGLGVKVVVADVFPNQQQHGSQQKEGQLLGLEAPDAASRTQQPARSHQGWHHRHRVHGPLDGSSPETAPLLGHITRTHRLQFMAFMDKLYDFA